MDVLFICKKRNEYDTEYGPKASEGKPHLTFGLHNSANFIKEFLNSHHIDSEIVTADDGNCIDRLVTNYNPKVVIIEALWATPDKFRELFSIPRHQTRKWIVRLHSRIGFIANEGIAFPWLCEYAKIPKLTVAPNTEEFTKDLSELLNSTTVYLPNIYHTDESDEEDKKKKRNKTTVNIGCFGAIRPMKNHLNQAVAAIKFSERHNLFLKFHVNASRVEQQGGNVLKNLRALFDSLPNHKLIEHEWLPHDEFVRLCRTMDIGMQVSFTETYNIVAADCVSNDVPFVGSSQITWLPSMCQADPNSTEEIAEVLDKVWWGSMLGIEKYTKYLLFKNSNQAKTIWLNYIKLLVK